MEQVYAEARQAELQKAAEEERSRIYRDLHDDVFEATIVTTLPERQRQRLQESGGSVQWQSQPGQECQVTLELYGTAEHD